MYRRMVKHTLSDAEVQAHEYLGIGKVIVGD